MVTCKTTDSIEITISYLQSFKVPIRGLGILHISNLRMLMRKIVIYLVSRKFYLRGPFLLLKLTEVTSTQESVKRFSYRHIPGLTSYPSTLTPKKSMKMNFSADKIYCNFSHEYPKISNM